MKHTSITALIATALCALVTAPAFAADSVLPTDQYVKYAKVLNGTEPAETTNVVKGAVSDVVQAAGEKAQQAVGEIAAALTAVATVKGETDPVTAAAIMQSIVAAASDAGSDKAEKLILAKIAAAVGAFVSAGADYISDLGAGLSKGVAKEVRAAADNAGETLADVDAFMIKSVYETTLEVLRGGSYQMKEDSDALGLGGAEMEIPTDFDSGSASSTAVSHEGIFVGKVVPSTPEVVPVRVPGKKKPRPNPTEQQQR